MKPPLLRRNAAAERRKIYAVLDGFMPPPLDKGGFLIIKFIKFIKFIKNHVAWLVLASQSGVISIRGVAI